MTPRRPFVAPAIGGMLLLTTAWLTLAVISSSVVEIELDVTELEPDGDHAYVLQLLKPRWPRVVTADQLGAPKASPTELYENDSPLGPAHASHASIREVGQGRYSHWQDKLYFSTSDNTDPRSNGRLYRVLLHVRLATQILWFWLLSLAAAGAAALLIGWWQGRIRGLDALLPLVLGTGVALGVGAVAKTEGVSFWPVVGLVVILFAWTLEVTRRTVVRGTGGRWHGFESAIRATLVVTSLSVVLTASEAVLMFLERHPKVSPEQMSAKLERALQGFDVEVPKELLRQTTHRATLLTLPPELERSSAEVPGAASAYLWHGALHVQDANRLRRTEPFPEKQDQTFRILVVGDSLTYGQGIDERFTYARQLESLLAPDYDAEVLNLGVSGHQSEDVLRQIRKFLPQLRPDLVVYGVCSNDFLPSGIHQYQNPHAYRLPLPESLKRFFTDRSRLARWSQYAYKQALLGIGLRVDFFDEILDGFSGYQERFAGDVTQMNQLVTELDLPPVVALTLDRRPELESRGYRITRAAERYLQAAGMDVIVMAPFYEQFHRIDFRVSRFEGHPNEIANAIWATLLNQHLRDSGVLQPFRRQPAAEATTVPVVPD